MSLAAALRAHKAEYAIEAFGLGMFMLSACAFVVLLEHPASPVHAALPSALLRRMLMGLAMGLTSVAIIYSPWGRRSGAHLNPSVTLAFYRLGRVPRPDAIFYVLAQLLGGVIGVGVAAAALGGWLRDPATHYAATVPGAQGAGAAFAGELAISFVLMSVVVRLADSPLSRFTGACAGALVALWIVIEAPLSGMSMNPARTLASALFAGDLRGLWIYLVAPPLGMLGAALLYARSRQRGCAKLVHLPGERCIFCEQRSAMRTSPPQRIVVVGGGFGAVFTARALMRLLAGCGDYEVVLIAKENYFVFQPMLPEVISGTIGLLDMVSPLRALLPGVELHIREVESIDLARRRVITAPGFLPRAHEVAFDHLVLAPGTVTDFRGLRGLPEHALPFKNLEDALRLRNHIIHALEEAAIEGSDPMLRKQLLTFVVAGGGFSGVEVVAELNDFVRGVAKSFPSIDPAEIRVVLLHSQEHILPEVAPGLGLFAERKLAARGVELRLKTRLSAATGADAVLATGERIPTRTLVSTVPSSPHPLIDALDVPKEKGRIRVDSRLRVEGAANLWALGDCALVPTPEGRPAPPPRSTPCGRPRWPRTTSRPPCAAASRAPSPSRAWARWARSAATPPSPRSSASLSPALWRGSSGAPST